MFKTPVARVLGLLIDGVVPQRLALLAVVQPFVDYYGNASSNQQAQACKLHDGRTDDCGQADGSTEDQYCQDCQKGSNGFEDLDHSIKFIGLPISVERSTQEKRLTRDPETLADWIACSASRAGSSSA